MPHMGAMEMQSSMDQKANMKEFRKIVKSLPEGQQARLPEKIRDICNNRREHTEFLKAIVMGVYLDLNGEISLTGYVSGLPESISADGQYSTAIRDNNTDTMIVGEDKIERTMTPEDFKKKVLYA